HAEIRVDRLGRVEGEVVGALPAERVAFAPLQPGEIYALLAQPLDVGGIEVIADDTDEPYRRVPRRGHREVRCGAAEHAVAAVDGRANVVVRERPDDQDARAQAGPERNASTVMSAYVAASASATTSVSMRRSSAPFVAQ